MPTTTAPVPAEELTDRELEAVTAGKDLSYNLPEFSPRSRLRTRILDEISIKLT